ncbi:hypothetical protein LTR72_006001 [Exophiala xenobiotica]|nr:hypothetical protein LTR92_005970 [Exophiala xenobiotica]KAK5221746.1 hypothetical protein LTR72_006001 [Exophiala xenobiotica]KAK5294781.1 hypothetical protein LTR14_003949 [Exophiala xenobiotica]KAK5438530.1 hypothetical protein LTR18_008506 [Exophiala xenobiotica]KAK5483179.1 hypothetical protein LTR55_006579 [Exophiala xenobiotica]
MPVSLRQRLDCHYCGRRSKFSRSQGRRFQCEHCLAVNFFDENGEIADVPVEEAAPEQRFAQPIAIDPLQDDFSTQDSIFCSTCLKNQQLYTYNLSQFLPEPDHPDYEKLEAELPAYKKGLEERYPQCCARCEPRVRARLHQATYNARSDHLRRVLEKSRQRRIGNRLGWRSLLVSTAGLGYFLSVAMQLAWHLYGSQISDSSLLQGFEPIVCLKHRPFVAQCLDVMEPFVGLSLALGLLCIWWNPKWQHKLSNNEGTLAGLSEYYLVQLALLGVRFGAWTIMYHVPLSTRTSAMLHACFTVAITVVAGWSVFGIIKVKSLAPVNWHDDPAPLLARNQFVPPEVGEQQNQDQAFNIGNLATAATPTYQEWRPPTPPEDQMDSMDWTPTQQTFQPELKHIRYQSINPSPFHGTLPALNTRGVRKNDSQPGIVAREAIGIPPGFFDRPTKPTQPVHQQEPTRQAMAQPKFFPKEADTGLENIFGSVFSLQDRSLDPSNATPRPTGRPVAGASRAIHSIPSPGPASGPTSLAIFSGISFFATLMSVAVWIFEATVTLKSTRFGYYVVLLSACIPIGHLMLHLSQHGVQGQFVRLLIYALEASFLIGVAMLREPFGELFQDLWTKVGIAAIALLLPQEFLHMNKSSGNLRSRSIQQAPLQRARERQNLDSPQELPPQTPSLARRDSTDSIESKTSIATTSTVPEWSTPKPDRPRFDMAPTSARATTPRSGRNRPYPPERRPSERSNLGMDGLSLSDHSLNDQLGSGARRGHGAGWGLESSGANIAGPRTRRGY